MKKIVGMFSILLLISCSPDANLMAENEQLKLEAEKQRELAMQSAAKARNAQAEALRALEEAENASCHCKGCWGGGT